VHTDHERAASLQPATQTFFQRQLGGPVEVGEDAIATKDQVERPSGHLAPDVLLPESDSFAPCRADAVEVVRSLERAITESGATATVASLPA
jgi:hypothetical protein